MRPNRRFSSATSACNCSIVRACASISAHNSAREGCSDPDTAHDHHTSRPGHAATHRKIAGRDLNGYPLRHCPSAPEPA
jgi:hypothetical protein